MRFTAVVLDQALSDAAQWRRRGFDVPVAVNLFPPLVGDITLPCRIFDALAREVAQGIHYSPPIAAPAIMELIGLAGSTVS